MHNENISEQREARGGFPDVADRSLTSRSRRVGFFSVALLRGNGVQSAARFDLNHIASATVVMPVVVVRFRKQRVSSESLQPAQHLCERVSRSECRT